MTHLRKPTRPGALRVLVAALGASALFLSGCNKPSEPPPTALQQAPGDAQLPAAPLSVAVAPAPPVAPVPERPAALQTANPAPATPAPAYAAIPAYSPAPALASTRAAYTPPSANQLYQLVAPIAVYPDKLVAQVLAASTYPQQISQANRWLARNDSLRGGALADAADRQPWDPSVKSLVAFRSVLDQLADNLPWTTALGDAYYNDPGDVMNAIQVMRHRAMRSGQLKNSNRLRVATGAARPSYTPDRSVPVYYAGPIIVEPPPQLITITPAQPDLVYVPTYDPQMIYGEPVRVYPGYTYSPPPPPPVQQQRPGYSGAQLATSGALGFGLGVVVGAALERHDWGWHAWGVDWGGQDPRRSDDRRPRSEGAAPLAQRPAVVYNNQTYVSRSETVINNEVHNVYNNAPSPQAQALEARQAQQLEQARQTLAQQTQQVQAQQAQLEQQQAALKQQQAQQANQDQQAQLKRQEAQLQEQQARLRQQQEQLHQQQLQQAKAQEAAAQQAQEQSKAQELAKAQEQAKVQALQQAKAKDEKAQQDKSNGSKDAAHQKEAGAAQAAASQARTPEQQVSTGAASR